MPGCRRLAPVAVPVGPLLRRWAGAGLWPRIPAKPLAQGRGLAPNGIPGWAVERRPCAWALLCNRRIFKLRLFGLFLAVFFLIFGFAIVAGVSLREDGAGETAEACVVRSPIGHALAFHVGDLAQEFHQLRVF